MFLQQFGRGLRRAPGKAELVVFDLTGRQHLQFRFDRRLRSLLGHTPRELAEFVHKLIHVGDDRRLGMWARLASLESPVDEADRRLTRMLFAVLYGKEIGAGTRAEAMWAEHGLLREEIAGLVPILRELNAVLTPPHALAPRSRWRCMHGISASS